MKSGQVSQKPHRGWWRNLAIDGQPHTLRILAKLRTGGVLC